MIVRASRGATTWWTTAGLCTLLAVLAGIASPRPAFAETGCTDASGHEVPPIAHLVSTVGEVSVAGSAPRGEAPYRPICAGETVVVGPKSRAAVNLIGADTPLRLDENTVSQFEAPPEPGSGLVELVRGGLYFLSEVRRTLTVRTPYVNAGVEGTEVYLRVADGGMQMMVLEGRVAATPGSTSGVPFATSIITTGQQLTVAQGAAPKVADLPDDGAAFNALRRVMVGALSWTLFYPEVLVGDEAAGYPAITEAARLLVAGQRQQAEPLLARIPDAGVAGALAAVMRTSIAVARRDLAEAQSEAARAVKLAPDAAAPRLALSYARQLTLDLDGAVEAAREATVRAPQQPLPQARLAELYLMRGDVRRSRQAADVAARLGGSPLTDIAQGFAALAALRGADGEAAFRRALRQDSQNPTALLGLGIALIKQGELAAGTAQLQNAAAADPGSSLLRSYLGRANVDALRDEDGGKQLAIAKELDPHDPTPWYLNALRLQLDNRPVEALRDIQTSIALNDNRAVFRSPLLLQQDLAARGASLGRIYEDLGFDEAGQLEATRSIALDPSSASAHRFLSDLYIGQPRLEVARASQLLVSQLLSPPSSDPVQPSAPFTDLDVIPPTGPLRPGFNEYSALFDRDRVRFSSDGAIGNNDTHTVENLVSGLYGRTSLSAGQFYYHSNGFRPNNGVQHEIYSVFGETQLTPDLSIQAEYRYRKTHQGDLSQDFDSDGFSNNLDRDIDQHVGRFGAQYSIGPGSTFLTSIFVGEREEEASDLFPTSDGLPPIGGDFKVRARGWSGEAQYIKENTSWNGVFGLGTYPIENRSKDFVDFPFPIDLFQPDERTNETESVDQYSAYAYLTATPTPKLQATAGAALDTVDNDLINETKLNPKFGVRYQVLPDLTLRVAYFRTLKRELLFQQTIQPTQVAGFNQLYDDFTGTRASVWALGADGRLPFGILAGVEGAWRALDVPAGIDGGTVTDQADEWRAGGYLFRTLGERWAVGARAEFDYYKLDDDPIGRNDPEDVKTWLFPLTARWFHPSGLFAEASASFLYQQVSRTDEATFEEGSDDTWLLGAAVGWRLPDRRGLIALQVANLLDSHFKYEDDSFRTNEEVGSRFIPDRTVLLRANLNF
jgi:tetratricopeptide (TPR) repeat protein